MTKETFQAYAALYHQSNTFGATLSFNRAELTKKYEFMSDLVRVVPVMVTIEQLPDDMPPLPNERKAEALPPVTTGEDAA